LGETQTTLQAGVKGVNSANNRIAVRGEANATGSVGVWGQSSASTGVYGVSTDGIGVWGQSTSGPAMRADGNAVQATFSPRSCASIDYDARPQTSRNPTKP
jgi:hypothetical protein